MNDLTDCSRANNTTIACAFKYLMLHFTLAVFLLLPITVKSAEKPLDKITHFDLPGQSLQSALIEFALQADLTLIVSNKTVKQGMASPVVGPWRQAAALRQLLSKSALDFRYEEPTDSVVIIPRAEPEATIKQASQKTLSEPRLLEEIVVSGSQYPFRYHTIRNSYTHSHLSSFDVARHFNTLPKTLIEDAQPESVTELLQLSSSSSPGDGLANSNDDYFIRGFQRNAIFIDGFRLDSHTGTFRDPITMESATIIKGPSTLHFGQAEPGGVVNIIPNQPEEEDHYRLHLNAGSGQEQSIAADIGSSLLSENLRYRLIAKHETRETWGSSQDIERSVLAPSIDWQVSSNMSLFGRLELQKARQTRQQDTLIYFNDGDDITLATLSEDQHSPPSPFQSEFGLLTTGLNYQLNQNWRLSAKGFLHKEKVSGLRGQTDDVIENDFLITEEDVDTEEQFFLIGLIPIVNTIGTDIEGTESNTLQIISLFDENNDIESQFFKATLEGSSTSLFTTHHLTLGFDAYHLKRQESFTLEKRNDLTDVNLLSRMTTPGNRFFGAATGNTDNNARNENAFIEKNHKLEFYDYALYAQDTLELSPQLLFSLGARASVIQGRQTDLITRESQTLTTFNDITQQYGLTYKVFSDIAFYWNYSKSILANYQIDDFGQSFDTPEHSTQHEVGFKGLFLSGKLLTSSSLFHIKKENIVLTTFDDGLRIGSASGEQRVKGIDWDFTFNANSALDIVGAFSYLEPSTASQTPLLGSKKTGSLFFNYSVQTGILEGVEFNFGAYYLGERATLSTDNITLPSYHFFNAGVSRHFYIGKRQLRWDLAIKNIEDKRFVTSTEGTIRSTEGAGRQIRTHLEWAF